MRQRHVAIDTLQPGNATHRHGEPHLAAGIERNAVEQDRSAGHARRGQKTLPPGCASGQLGRDRVLIEDQRHCSPPERNFRLCAGGLAIMHRHTTFVIGSVCMKIVRVG